MEFHRQMVFRHQTEFRHQTARKRPRKTEETLSSPRQTKKPKEGLKTENDHINLKVAGQDDSVVQFKTKKHTRLSKLMKAYCERQDRPAQLKMEDEDKIDVFQQQTGGVFKK
ncbi:PREDICTED: small ubiquitin-related modifier 3-like [Elephantulus edwardii]|uniref:small ubiquitin-related modifier 3-like n=1 Tax=Elephantulus edwardii TaxID=28737 RepID=UPI0003F08C36|nr:PREDICTED: small ubiquitin-related modifier 3-like [Elephantulus edwardii]